MMKLITKVGAAVVMAAAITPFVAAAAAHAQPAAVRTADLNLAHPAQVSVLNGRIEHVARQICESYADPRNIGSYDACLAAVRAEANDKLSAQALDQAGFSSSMTVASR